jgi:hypothetical protein
MHEWMTPQGILAICGVVTTVILPLIVHMLGLMGKKELADKVQLLTTRAEGAEHGLASVISGVQDFKGLGSPESVSLLVDTLRSKNEQSGAQGLVGPVVEAVSQGAPVIEAVRSATTRLARPPIKVS